MNIEKLINELGKAVAKLIFNKKENTSDKINIEQMDSTDIFNLMLHKFSAQGNYVAAEDLIFNELETNPSTDIYDISVNFYNSLLEKSDEELESRNFPKSEVYMGLNDIKKKYAS